MNRIVTLRFDPVGRRLSRRPSSTRRAGFYAADMTARIIFGGNSNAPAGRAEISSALPLQGSLGIV
jgi:hypothetical protein